MAISDSVQVLSGAFSFGILLQTAVSAFIIHLKGHGSTIFQDRRRLVLITFILSSALWAQIGFLNFMISPGNSNICQGTVVTGTFFDQAARTLSGAFLLWTVAGTSKSTAEKYGLGALIGARAVSGIVFVVCTRPQFAPLCVPRSSVLPVSILVIVLDTIVFGVVAIRSITLGFWGGSNRIRPASNQKQVNAIALFAVGFAIWTGTSITLQLGIASIILLLRSAIPAIGLTILLTVVTIWPEALLSPREIQVGTPESHSPFIAPPRPQFNSPSTGDGSPRSGTRMAINGRLFVVNPSNTPNDSPQLRSSRDAKSKMNFASVMVNSRSVDTTTLGIPTEEARADSGIFGNYPTALGGTNTVISAPLPSVPSTQRSRPIWDGKEPQTKPKRSFFGSFKQPAQTGPRKLAISQPILVNTEESSATPFSRIQTVDLVTAAANERVRREEAAARRVLVATRPAPAPPMSLDPSDALKRSISTVRKEPSRNYQDFKSKTSQGSVSSNGSSSSSSLSPLPKDVRRRSPRQLDGFDIDEKRQYYSPKIANTLKPNPNINEFQHPPQGPETVMFMNDIVYNDPGLVNSIISEVPNFSKKTTPSVDKSISAELSATPSILHRARPFKKSRDNEAAFFPSEPSPNHRRVRSSTSMLRARYIGSPTSLPPLPQPPVALTEMRGLLKDRIHNMTNDEKVSMLFPAPPVGAFRMKRRSSVPSLSSTASVTDTPDTLGLEDAASRKSSRRSTIISLVPVESRGNLSPKKHTRKLIQRDTYRSTYNAPVPDISSDVVQIRKSNIPPPVMYSSFTETTEDSDYGHMVRDSEWLQEPLPTLPRSYTSQRDSSSSTADSLLKDRHFMSLMMGHDTTKISANMVGQTSFLHDSTQTFGTEPIITSPCDTWHKRIGDAIPAFSSRPNHSRSKSVPPTPLTLCATKSKISVQRSPTPPVPISTPSLALKEIQDRLKQPEEPDLLPFIRDRSSSLDDVVSSRRSDLLAEMEKEVGEQEDKWQLLHNNINRNSEGSEVFTPWTAQRSSVASIISEKAASIKEARKAGVRNISEAAQNIVIVTGKRNGDIAKPGLRKDKLDETQKSYANNTPSFSNSLSSSKVVIARQTSIRTVNVGGAAVVAISPSNQRTLRPAHLWKPSPPEATARVGHLWTPPPKPVKVRTHLPEPAALSVRPAQRRSTEPLRLYSLHMWSKPTPTRARPTPGLWRSKNTRPASIVTRPKTQRPARKSRPMTFLPDIVESPSPLPHKMETLGIFQFPWGEKSDQAVYQPALPVLPTMPRLMIPNTLSSNYSNEEYSSSFFDDYDDHEYQTDSSSFDIDSPSDEGSDDGFDDSTLWEIANLLDSEEVPSRDSLLPQFRIIEDCDDSEDEMVPAGRMPVVRFMPIMPLSPNPKSPASRGDVDSDPEALALTPVPSKQTQWPLIPSSDVGSIDFRPEDLLEDRSSYSLYTTPTMSPKTASKLVAKVEPTTAWWDVKSHLPRGPRDTPAFKEKQALMATISSKSSSYLWTPAKPTVAVTSNGLFNSTASAKVREVTSLEPAAINMYRKPRPSTAPLPTISSTKLWSDDRRMSLFTFDWISESTVRARSPSIGSSSGYSSPGMATESDGYSIKTVSTKASSLQSERNSIGVPFVLEEVVSVKKPIRKARRTATPEEWNAALNDAIQASATPTKKLTATKEMWAHALQEALHASAQSPTKGLWSKAIALTTTSKNTTLLWSLQNPRGESKATIMTPAAGVAFKKSSEKTTTCLPKLASTSLWSASPPAGAVSTVRSWLHEAAAVSQIQPVDSRPILTIGTWTPSAPSRSSLSRSSNGLWRPSTRPMEQPQALITLPTSPRTDSMIRESKAAGRVKNFEDLPVLKSSHLWRPTWAAYSKEDGSKEKSWIHERGTSRVNFRY